MRYRLLRLYTRALSKHPKTTNAVMTGTLFGVGDISAQLLFSHSEHPRGNKYVTSRTAITTGEQEEESGAVGEVWSYDYARTARAVIYGSLIFSFIGDKWYKVLNYKIRLRNRPITDWTNRLLRVSVDQLMFAPISLPFYFGCMTAMEGKSWNVAKNKIKDQWWSTLLTNWAVWPIFQTVNFSFVPLQHQLLAVNVVAIFWNTYLSHKNSKASLESQKVPVHYPPVVE